MTIKRYLPLNLQMFADNPPPEGSSVEGSQKKSDDKRIQKELQRESIAGIRSD